MNTLELLVVTLNAGGGRRDAAPEPAQAGAGLGAALAGLGHAPDLLGLQEASRLWHGRARQCLATSLAAALGTAFGTRYRAFFFPILDSRRHPALSPDPSPQVGGGARGGSHSVRIQLGNAILVRRDTGLRLAPWPWTNPPPGHLAGQEGARSPSLFPLVAGGREGDPSPFTLHPSPSVPLDLPLPPPRLYSTGSRDTEPRHLALAPLTLHQGQRLYFMTTHLATLSGERGPGADPQRAREASDLRRLQCEALREVVAELRKAEARRGGTPAWSPAPILLAGDFNAAPGSPELGLLGAADSGPSGLRPARRPRWWNEPAAPADAEAVWTHAGDRVHIDHILVDDPAGRLEPLDCLIWNDNEVEKMTDHYPVVARFALRGAEERP